MSTVNKTVIVTTVGGAVELPKGAAGGPGLNTKKFSTSYYDLRGWSNNAPYWSTFGIGGLGGAAGAGTLICAKIHLPYLCTVTSLQYYLSSLQVGGTTGQNHMALYDLTGLKIAETGDLTSEWGSGSIGEVRTSNLASSVRCAAGYYWVAFCWNGSGSSTGIGMMNGALATTMNLNVTGLAGRAMTANTGVTTTMPTQLSGFVDISRLFWVTAR